MSKVLPFVSKGNTTKTNEEGGIPWDQMNPKFRKSVKFVYYRDEEHRPVLTECVIDLDFGTFKGWALWNPEDIINKQDGRTHAFQRAIAALSDYVLNRWNHDHTAAAFTMFPVQRPGVQDRISKLGVFLTAKAIGMPKVKAATL